MRHRVQIIFILAIIISSGLAGFLSAAEEKEEEKPKKNSFIILPIVYYTPETHWAGGLGGFITVRPEKAKENSRPSSFPFVLIYTQNAQFTVSATPELYFKNESYVCSSRFEFSKFPSKFFGIGNNTPEIAEEGYTPLRTSVEISLSRKLWPDTNFFAGLQYNYDHYKFLKFDPQGALIKDIIPGSRGGTISGFGLLVKWDSRDNVFVTSSGRYFQLLATLNSSLFASDYNFAKFKMDLRSYFPVFKSHVLALQGVFQAESGTTPFMAMPKFGGDTMMRGYYSGRYRDKILAAVQAEYRLPIWSRFGLAGFVGFGDVTDRLNHLKLGDFKYSVGGGLRFKISPREGANVRLDFGFGKGCSGMYFMFNEPF